MYVDIYIFNSIERKIEYSGSAISVSLFGPSEELQHPSIHPWNRRQLDALNNSRESPMTSRPASSSDSRDLRTKTRWSTSGSGVLGPWGSLSRKTCRVTLGLSRRCTVVGLEVLVGHRELIGWGPHRVWAALGREFMLGRHFPTGLIQSFGAARWMSTAASWGPHCCIAGGLRELV